MSLVTFTLKQRLNNGQSTGSTKKILISAGLHVRALVHKVSKPSHCNSHSQMAPQPFLLPGNLKT